MAAGWECCVKLCAEAVEARDAFVGKTGTEATSLAARNTGSGRVLFLNSNLGTDADPPRTEPRSVTGTLLLPGAILDDGRRPGRHR